MLLSRLDLSNTRAVVTGASSGIGHALALRLAEQRVRVVVTGRTQARLESLATAIRQRGGDAHVIVADVADAGERARLIESAVAALGGLDILINNAGVGAKGPFREASEERLRQIMEVNFFGCTELTRLALPHLLQGRNPMIVNVGSILGIRAIPGMAEYCASKFALQGWSESLRAELVRNSIHVLTVCPGTIETEFRDHMLEDRSPPSFRGRGMTADRCAALIVAAMRARRNEIVITAGAKTLAWLNRLSPRFVDWLMARYARHE